MLAIEDALRLVLERVPSPRYEDVPLDLAVGRFAGTSVRSDLDLPPFDRARMDGYAVCAASTIGANGGNRVRLRELGGVAAGESFTGEVQPGEAVRIMTGAPVPAGADAVERIEVIRVIEDGGERWIELSAEVARGRNITPRGLEARCGDEVVSAGVRVTPGVAAVLATFGCQQVTAASRPRLALLSTGSELVPVDSQPVAGQIRDSNSFSLAGYAREAGAEIVSSEIVPDDFDQTVRAIDRALGAAEVVILSGGVSMGDYDLVKPALSHLGAEIIFDRVAMHPGKPTVLAKRGDQLIFGLPGNPVSVAVAFFLFVRPALLKMQGALQVELPRATLFCAGNVKGAPPRRSHQPGRLRIVEGRAEIEPLRWSGSGDLIGFMRADSLLVIPEDRAAVATGDLVEAILLP